MTDIADPFAEDVDENDPFATSEDVKGGGSYSPSPKWEDLEGRLVALFPREFTDQAPKPEQFRQNASDTVRDRWTLDLVVLDGGPFTFEYPGPPVERGERETLMEDVSDIPALFPGKWVHEASIIGQLNKAQRGPRPVVMGRVTRGPQAKDRKAGKTAQDIADAFAAWRKNPKGNPPRFSWQIDVDSVTAADREVAARWLKTARAGGFTV